MSRRNRPVSPFIERDSMLAGVGVAFLVVCPLCKLSYNHQSEAVPYTEGRASGVAFRMACENGHTWYMTMYQYKGNTFIEGYFDPPPWLPNIEHPWPY